MILSSLRKAYHPYLPRFLSGAIQMFFFEWFLFMNVPLMLGIWGLLLSLLYSQYDRLPNRAHFASLLTGVLIGLLASPSFVTLSRDESLVNASYDPIIPIFSVILLSLFILSILRPMLIKFKKQPRYLLQRNAFLLLGAYMLVILWTVANVLTGVAEVRLFRPLLFGLAMLFWALALYVNPLELSLTSASVKYFVITDKAGLSILSCDMTTGQEVDSALLSALLSAIKSGIESYIEGSTSLRTVTFQKSQIMFVESETLTFMMVVDGPASSNLELLGKVYLDRIEKTYKEDLAVPGLVKVDRIKQEIPTIVNLIRSVTVYST